MNNYRGISLKLCMLLLTGLFAFANVSAQDSDAEKSKNVRTKKAQAVSKEVYDDIIKAQRREIKEMKWLIDDITTNGLALSEEAAKARPVPAFEGELNP